MGVITGVLLVAVTGYARLDPIVALVVGANIIVTGIGLLSRALSGLMDSTIPAPALAEVNQLLQEFADQRGVSFHAVQTRAVGRNHLVAVHAVVPAEWSVEQGHELTLDLEAAVAGKLKDTLVQTHVEPTGHVCAEASR